MALLTAAARRASALLRSTAAAVPFSSIRRRSYSSSSSSIRYLRAKAAAICRAEAASYRAEAVSFRAKADSLRAATHDGELLGVIDSAMHSCNGNLGEEIPSEFPFEISKIEELTRTDVTLTRCLKGEKIEVLVSMPILASDEEDDDLQESSNSSSSSSDETSSSSDNETSSSSDDSSWYSDETSSSSDSETSSSDESSSSSEDEAKNRRQEYLPLTVTVSKPDGSSMEFACNAYHYAITIDTVSVRQRPSGAEEGDNNAYDEGPDFSDLDENLQEGLHKYLEVRGITPNNIKLLHKYIISKERRHYQVWLAMLRHFVRKN